MSPSMSSNWGCQRPCSLGIGRSGPRAELVEFLKDHRLRTDFVQRDQTHETGTVTIRLDHGHASYRFLGELRMGFSES